MPHHWLAFFSLVAALLIIDLALLQRPGRPVSARIAWLWTAFLALLACAFSLYLARTSGKQPALEFLTGYLIEGSLSIDNLFVFLLLFRAFHLGDVYKRQAECFDRRGGIHIGQRQNLALAHARVQQRLPAPVSYTHLDVYKRQ